MEKSIKGYLIAIAVFCVVIAGVFFAGFFAGKGQGRGDYNAAVEKVDAMGDIVTGVLNLTEEQRAFEKRIGEFVAHLESELAGAGREIVSIRNDYYEQSVRNREFEARLEELGVSNDAARAGIDSVADDIRSYADRSESGAGSEGD